MTEPLDTYAAYAARMRAAKKAAGRARKVEKVWRAHLKRQYKQYCKYHGSNNMRVRAMNSFQLELLPIQVKAARYTRLHWVRVRFIQEAHKFHPLP